MAPAYHPCDARGMAADRTSSRQGRRPQAFYDFREPCRNRPKM